MKIKEVIRYFVQYVSVVKIILYIKSETLLLRRGGYGGQRKNPYMTAGAHLTINLKLNFSSVQIDDLLFLDPIDIGMDFYRFQGIFSSL
jgi:hypothetical protein